MDTKVTSTTARLDHKIVFAPPRCPYKRAARWGEVLKFTLIGWLIASDPEHELQCHHYSDHAQFPGQEEHETVDGTKWL